MLTLYRRHLAGCIHKAKGRTFKRCRCPIWVQGTFEGIPMRKALDVTSWERAEDLKREIEDGKPARSDMPVKDAIASFADDLKARNVSPATAKKYRVLTDQLAAFCAAEGIEAVREFGLDSARQFRQGWKDAPVSASKKLERLRSVLRHFHESGWMGSNPARLLKPPKVDASPTRPIPDEHLERIAELSTERQAAMWYVFRFTGLRISDVVQLNPEKLKGDTVFLRTAKTGVPVGVPIPRWLVERLDALEPTGGYYFWNRLEPDSATDTASGNVRRTLRRICKAAGLPAYHPHQWRDSFAVSLLEQGTPIEDVAALLGNSPEIAAKHYSPWVQSRQQRLEERVRRTWQEPKAKPAK